MFSSAIVSIRTILSQYKPTWLSRSRYNALDCKEQRLDVETNGLARHPPQSKAGISVHNVVIGIAIFIITIFLTESTHYLISTPSVSNATLRPLAGHCGNSSTEAQQLGCVWDPISTSWLPSTCTLAGADEFAGYLPNEKWRYWRDRDGLQQIPLEDLPFYSPEEKYYTTNGEHITHCAFSFLRMAELLRAGGPADWMVGQYQHNVHCAMLLAEVGMHSPSFNHIGSSAYVRYGTC